MALKFPQLQPFTLYSSGVSVGDATMVLASFKSIDGVQLTMADFGAKGYMTVEPGAGLQEEQISFTSVTLNANGTTTLGGIKNVLFLYPFTETAGFVKQHSGGSLVVVSVSSAVLNTFVNSNDDETIAGTYTFTNPNVPRMDASPTYGAGTEFYLVTKEYADALAIAGAPDASTTQKGIVEIATQTEVDTGAASGGTSAQLVPTAVTHLKTMDKIIVTSINYGAVIAVNQAVYLDTAAGTWKVADAAVTSTAFTCFGIALDAGGIGATGKRVQVGGLISTMAGLTAGYAYLGTAGALQVTPGALSKVVGYAFSATELFIIPTLDISALFGVTSVVTTDNIIAAAGIGKQLFGPGTDGDKTVAAPETLTSDKYYDNLTLNDDLNANGYRIYVKGTLTRAAGKKIYNNGSAGGVGGDATSGTGGAAGAAGTKAPGNSLPEGVAGMAGAVGANINSVGNNGVTGTSVASVLSPNNGSAGGNGGATTSGPAGGTGGVAGVSTQTKSLPKTIGSCEKLIDVSGSTVTAQRTSAASGSGASGAAFNGVGDASGGGGGSGSTGGIVYVCAYKIVSADAATMLQAKGGAGGNAGNGFATTFGGSGGGGGGNGGAIILIHSGKTGTVTTDVTGGAGGSKSLKNGAASNGTDGAAGNAGFTFELDLTV